MMIIRPQYMDTAENLPGCSACEDTGGNPALRKIHDFRNAAG